MNVGKCKLQPQGDALADENYTKFSIPIHQILAQVKDNPWVKRPPPLKGDSAKRETIRYCTFHGTQGHYTNDCFTWKKHLEELVREGHYTSKNGRSTIRRWQEDAQSKG